MKNNKEKQQINLNYTKEVEDKINYDENENSNEEDDRLSYTLLTLGLENLIHIFEENNISFVDLLLLSKDDLIELQLEMYQRNRIFYFSKLFTKYGKSYSINEISDFFSFNKQFIFNSVIFDRISTLNNDMGEEYQNNTTLDYTNDDNNNMKKKIISNLNYNFFDDKIENSKKLIMKNEINTKKYEKKINKTKSASNKTSKRKKGKIEIRINTNQNFEKNNLRNNNLKNIRYNTEPKKNLMKSKRAFQKYLEIQQDADLILDKLNKQREDIAIKKLKYQNLLFKKKNSPSNIFSHHINNIHKKYIISDLNDYEEEESKNNNLNEENNYDDDIDINEEYEKMINLIEETENNKIDNNTYQYLNNIKSFIRNKGIDITLEDIFKINTELNKIIKNINKNSKLNQENKKIHKQKRILNYNNDNSDEELHNKEGNYFDTMNNKVDEVEEVEEEYENDSNINE